MYSISIYLPVFRTIRVYRQNCTMFHGRLRNKSFYRIGKYVFRRTLLFVRTRHSSWTDTCTYRYLGGFVCNPKLVKQYSGKGWGGGGWKFKRAMKSFLIQAQCKICFVHVTRALHNRNECEIDFSIIFGIKSRYIFICWCKSVKLQLIFMLGIFVLHTTTVTAVGSLRFFASEKIRVIRLHSLWKLWLLKMNTP